MVTRRDRDRGERQGQILNGQRHHLVSLILPQKLMLVLMILMMILVRVMTNTIFESETRRLAFTEEVKVAVEMPGF